MRWIVAGLCLMLAVACGTMVRQAFAADAELVTIVTNGGSDVGGKADIHVYPAGTHTPTGESGKATVGWADSGQPIPLPNGSYDIRVTFNDGSAHKIVWLDNQAITGSVKKTVEIGLPVAEFTCTVTNGGSDVGNKGDVHVYPVGTHTANSVRNTDNAGWAESGQPIRLPAGTYDVRVTFTDGNAEKVVWLDAQPLAGTVAKTVEIGLPLADVHYIITNGGTDTGDKGDIHVYPAGSHRATGTVNNANVGWTTSGQTLRLPAGAYDVRITFEDGNVKKVIWLDNQTFSGQVEKTVEVGAAVATVRTVVTNGGDDVKDRGQVVYYPAGKRDGSGITWSNSGETVRLPEGSYDIKARFSDGAAQKEVWLTNQALAGSVEKTIEVGVAIATVRYVITNGGSDVGDKGEVHFFPQGHHEASSIDWIRSGGTSRLPQGRYDVHITFADGEAKRDLWLDDQTFAGAVQKTVEVGVPIGESRITVTNGGVDTREKGEAHYYPHGHHDGGSVGWARSGGTVRLPQGVYDIHITFADGELRKNLWLDNQTVGASWEQTIELGAPAADVRYVVTEHGTDVGDRGEIHYFAPGRRDSEIAWARSGDSKRLPEGAYDVEITFADGLIRREIWFTNQAFRGKVERSAELGLTLATVTVSVTEGGADVSDKATITLFEGPQHNNIGAVKGGESATVIAGKFDIRATLYSSEGWLHGMDLAGNQHLTIILQPLKAEQLKIGGPAPKSCTIEVYGVNFDFDKAEPRPDSDPMLKQVLALFLGSPDFRAEIGGHTDNVGAAGYNLKLSDARAAAVRSWLIHRGVAAERVTSHGYGDTRPLVPNSTDDNRAKNRRVELQRPNCR